jgi:hypothetical protein
MHRKKRLKKRTKTVPVWTYEQARNAQPYLSSILRSVRENRLDALNFDLTARRLDQQEGRPDRAALIALADARDSRQRAEDRFKGELQELADIGIYCLDPIRGEALVPFVHKSQLAWFLYELFENDPIRFWRFHEDPLEERRPIGEVAETSAKRP